MSKPRELVLLDDIDRLRAETERLRGERDAFKRDAEKAQDREAEACALIEGSDAERDEAREEVERLRRWKSEALVVLRTWDEVFDALDHGGRCILGGSKSKWAKAEVKRLRAIADAAARLSDMASPRWSQDHTFLTCVGCCQDGGYHDSDCPAIELERALAALDSTEVE